MEDFELKKVRMNCISP